MPFTPSHIAAVLPMMRRPVTRLPFVPTALVIGSMIPDVPLFTSHWPDYHQTHSVAGVLTVDALATCAAVALFHLVFRAPLAELLPRWIADRLPAPFGLGRVRDLVWIPVAAAAGAATHVAWDSFTHGRSVEIWGPRMATEVFGLPLFSLLQYLSTVLGLLGLVWWTARRLRALPPRPADGQRRLSPTMRTMTVLGIATCAVSGAVGWPAVHQAQGPQPTLFWAGVGLVTSSACAVTGYAGLFTAFRVARWVRQPAAASTISGLARPSRSETTASATPSGPTTP
jgi:hypothetical protein